MKDKKITVILLSGYKGSGKDYVANILHDKLETSVVMSYAQPIKDIIATTFGISHDDLDKMKNNQDTITTLQDYDDFGTPKLFTNMRVILQHFGTEAMKEHFGDNVWSELFISKMPTSGFVICPDWRFKVELYDLLKLDNVDVVKVRIDDYNLVGDGHASETELEDFSFDYRFNNTAKDESINAVVSNFINKLK